MNSNFSRRSDEFELVIDGSKAIVPCMSFNLYLDGTDRAGVLNFYERTRQALSGLLSHYETDSMASRMKMNLRSENVVPNLMKKLSASKVHYIAFSGCGRRDGISESGIEFSIVGWPPPNEQILGRRRSNWRVIHKQGGNLFLPLTKLRVTLPLDHSLSRSSGAFLEWISGFSLIREGNFVFGTCGLGVNYDEYTASSIIRSTMMQKLAQICTAYQGTEWNLPTEFERNLLRWNSDEDDIVPQIPRVSWLTLLGPQCLKFLKEKDIILDNQLDQSRVRQYLIGASSILRAGNEPTYGSPLDNDSLCNYHYAAEVLRPLQMADTYLTTSADCSWMRRWQYFL